MSGCAEEAVHYNGTLDGDIESVQNPFCHQSRLAVWESPGQAAALITKPLTQRWRLLWTQPAEPGVRVCPKG